MGIIVSFDIFRKSHKILEVVLRSAPQAKFLKIDASKMAWRASHAIQEVHLFAPES
jgi:hypothetical protein